MIKRRTSIVLVGLMFLSSCSSGGGESLRVRNAAATCYDTQAAKDRAADVSYALLEAPRTYLSGQAAQYKVSVEELPAHVANLIIAWRTVLVSENAALTRWNSSLSAAKQDLEQGNEDKAVLEQRIENFEASVDRSTREVARLAIIVRDLEQLLETVNTQVAEEQRLLKELSWIKDMPLCVVIEPIDDSEQSATDTSVVESDGATSESGGGESESDGNEPTDDSENAPSEIAQGEFGDCRDDMPGMFDYVLMLGEEIPFTFSCEVVGVTTYGDSSFEADWVVGGIVVRGVRVGTSQIIVATMLPSGAIFNWTASIEVVAAPPDVVVGAEGSDDQEASDEESTESTEAARDGSSDAESCQLLSADGPDRVDLYSTFDVVVRHTPCKDGEDPVNVLFTGKFAKFDVVRFAKSFIVRVTASDFGFISVLVNYPKEGRRQGFFKAVDTLVKKGAASEPCEDLEPILKYESADGGTLTIDRQCQEAVGVHFELKKGGIVVAEEGFARERLPSETPEVNDDLDLLLRRFGAITLTLEHVCRVDEDSFASCGKKASLSLNSADAVKPLAGDSSASPESTIVTRPPTPVIAAPPSAEESTTTTAMPTTTTTTTAMPTMTTTVAAGTSDSSTTTTAMPTTTTTVAAGTSDSSTTTTAPATSTVVTEQTAIEPVPVQWMSPKDSADPDPVFEPASISVDPGTVLLTCEEDCVADIAERTGAEPDAIQVQVDGGDWQPALGALIPIGVGTTNVRFKGTPQSGAPVELEANFYDSTTPIVPVVRVNGDGVITDGDGAVVGTAPVYESVADDGSSVLKWLLPLLGLIIAMVLIILVSILLKRRRVVPSTADESDRNATK